ncbi:MAG: hypothetical protein CV089_05250 [Nitrospira sp. WS110]|nr:hypothetical protein [Nitrospira sp. WS110]
MKLPADRQLLCICQQIAAVGIVLLFVVLFYVITFGWRGYLLDYPDPITDTVPSDFPVIAGGHRSSKSGVSTHELVTWGEWERRQTQGTASVWVQNGTGEGQQERESRRPLFYTYRMTELAPQRYMILVTITDRDDLVMQVQYRVEGNHIVPLTFGKVTGPTMAMGVAPLSLVLTVLCCWSLRAMLRWYTRYTGGEQQIRELLGQARLTLALLVGYYLFLASRRALLLVWRHG